MRTRLLLLLAAFAASACKSHALDAPLAPFDAGITDATATPDFVAADGAMTPSDLLLFPAPDLDTATHATRCANATTITFTLDDELRHVPAMTAETWYRSFTDPNAGFVELMVGAETEDFALVTDGIGDKRIVSGWFGRFVGSKSVGFVTDQFAWHHFAAQMERSADGTTIEYTAYRDGVRINTETGEPFFIDFFNPKTIYVCGKTHFRFFGELDDIRLSKVARYHDDFTPAPYVDDADTIAIVDFETLPLVDRSAYHHAITVEGPAPQLVAGHP